MTDHRMTWDEMVKKFPDQWVVVKDAEMSGPDILSGIVVAVMPDDQITAFRLSNTRRDYEFCRTTEGEFDGVIDSDISIAINESMRKGSITVLR